MEDDQENKSQDSHRPKKDQAKSGSSSSKPDSNDAKPWVEPKDDQIRVPPCNQLTITFKKQQHGYQEGMNVLNKKEYSTKVLMKLPPPPPPPMIDLTESLTGSGVANSPSDDVVIAPRPPPVIDLMKFLPDWGALREAIATRPVSPSVLLTEDEEVRNAAGILLALSSDIADKQRFDYLEGQIRVFSESKNQEINANASKTEDNYFDLNVVEHEDNNFDLDEVPVVEHGDNNFNLNELPVVDEDGVQPEGP